VELTMAELRAALAAHASESVVYLGRRVRLLASTVEEDVAVERAARAYCATSDFPVLPVVAAPPPEQAA